MRNFFGNDLLSRFSKTYCNLILTFACLFYWAGRIGDRGARNSPGCHNFLLHLLKYLSLTFTLRIMRTFHQPLPEMLINNCCQLQNLARVYGTSVLEREYDSLTAVTNFARNTHTSVVYQMEHGCSITSETGEFRAPSRTAYFKITIS